MTIIEEMTDYLINFIEIPHPNFDNLPICPFVKQARIKNKIQFEIYDFTEVPDDHIKKLLLDFKNQENYEIIWIIHPNKSIKSDVGNNLALNLQPFLEIHQLVAFGGGPDDNFKMKNVLTRKEPYVNIVIQTVEALYNARKILQNTKYYDV